MGTSPPNGRLHQAEAWWAFIARMMGFLFGAFLVYKQSLPPPGVEVWIVLAALGFAGPAVAGTVATVLTAARGGTSSP